MKFTINNVCGNVMYEVEADSFLKAVEQKYAYLRDADLCGADLRDADLRGAYLRGANLRNADLRGAYLRGANLRNADLRGADLCDAYLCDADLRDADLRNAYLRGAYLYGAYLYGADLRGADLRGADLRGAYLRGAKNISKFLTTTLYFLLDQPGKIRAYKLINANGEGPYNGGINYLKGKVFTAQANMDEKEQCAAGINLATLDWCMKEWREGYRILIMEFSPKRKNGAPNICVPIGSDGKFRVWECTMVGEKDLKELGLVKEKKLTSLQT